jgi:hypothetical protein
MRMARGRAFVVSGTASSIPPAPLGLSPETSIPVYKSWIHIQGRTFLLEEVPFARINPQFQTLHASASGTSNKKLRRTAFNKLPPLRPRMAEASTNRLRLARLDLNRKPGVVLDYVEISGSQDGDFTFEADTTYFVTDNFSI